MEWLETSTGIEARPAAFDLGVQLWQLNWQQRAAGFDDML